MSSKKKLDISRLPAFDPQSLDVSHLPAFSQEQAQGPEISPTESFVRGAAQNVSFGGADELAGAITGSASGAAKTALLGGLFGQDVSNDPDVQKYIQARDESRALYKAAEEQNPKSYLGGQVAGTVGSVLIPGMGLAKGAQGAGLLARLGSGIGGAAVLGGTAGGLTSSSDLSKGERGEFIKDTATGAAFGAGTAGLIKGAGKLLQLPVLKQAAQGFKFGAQSENLIGQEAERAVGKNVIDTVEKEAGHLTDASKENAILKKAFLERAEQQGKTVEIAPLLERANAELEQMPTTLPEWESAANKIKEVFERTLKNKNSTQLTPNEAEELRLALRQLAYDKDLKAPAIQGLAKSLSGDIAESVRGISPGVEKFTNNQKHLLEAQKYLNVGQGVDEYGVQQKLIPIFQRIEQDTSGGDVARATFERAIEEVRKANPELADQIAKSALNAAEKLDLVRQIRSIGSFNVGSLGAKTAKGLAAAGGNLEGQGLNKLTGGQLMNIAQKAEKVAESFAPYKFGEISQAVLPAKAMTSFAPDIEDADQSKIHKVSRNLYQADDEQLNQVAQKVGGHQGAALQQALKTKNNQQKNAILFSILQDPNKRKSLQGD